jgi:hypothetical protein
MFTKTDTNMEKDESKCFIDSQGKMHCDGVSYFTVHENVTCKERMCSIERNVQCNGQERCMTSKDRLSITPNNQIFDRFVNEKFTWK